MNNGIYKLSDDGKTLLGVTDKNISEAVIPDGVTHIGNLAFSWCRALQSIDIPDSITHIGDRAFHWCEALQSIEVAEGNQCFASIDGVLFNKDLTQIIRYPQAKYGSQYTIPNSVTHIGDRAFYGCKALQSIDIPNSITHIGDSAFSDCEALQCINIPNSVTHIGDSAFSECLALQSIDIPNSVTHIGDGAFHYCEALQSIDIPNSVTYIEDGAFEECWALQNIDIPNSMTHIGYYAFNGCEALQSIHIRITDIDSCCVKENAFYGIDFDNCILYIPSGTRWAYRHHPVFRNFKNIEIERIK